MNIFEKHYAVLFRYCENIIYKAREVAGKGFSAHDLIHDSYIRYYTYKEKFDVGDEAYQLQLLKNTVFWSFLALCADVKRHRDDRGRRRDEWSSDEFRAGKDGERPEDSEEPSVYSDLMNQEFSKFKEGLSEEEARILNLRLSGMNYQAINTELGLNCFVKSKVVLEDITDKLTVALDLESKDADTLKKIKAMLKRRASMSAIGKTLNLSPYNLKRKVKAIMGTEKYQVYSRMAQGGGCTM
jgi:DNA-directed RNA polymerase specialized sigma24 family protein